MKHGCPACPKTFATAASVGKHKRFCQGAGEPPIGPIHHVNGTPSTKATIRELLVYVDALPISEVQKDKVLTLAATIAGQV